MVFSGIRAAFVLSLMLGVAGVSAQQGDRSAGTSPSPRSASPAQHPASTAQQPTGTAQQPTSTAQQPTSTAQQPATSAPASAATPQAPPTFRGGISYVRVDAIVTDKKGQPVFDLKQSDF